MKLDETTLTELFTSLTTRVWSMIKHNFCYAYEALQVECCKMFANLNIIFAIYFAKTIWQINQQLDNVVILANLTFVHINHHIQVDCATIIWIWFYIIKQNWSNYFGTALTTATHKRVKTCWANIVEDEFPFIFI